VFVYNFDLNYMKLAINSTERSVDFSTVSRTCSANGYFNGIVQLLLDTLFTSCAEWSAGFSNMYDLAFATWDGENDASLFLLW